MDIRDAASECQLQTDILNLVIEQIRRGTRDPQDCMEYRARAVGACSRYKQIRSEFISLYGSSANAEAAILRFCPPVPDIPECPSAKPAASSCCVSIKCRDLQGVLGFLYTHCGIYVVDCKGTGTLYEVLNETDRGPELVEGWRRLGYYVYAIPIAQGDGAGGSVGSAKNAAYLRQYWTLKTQCWDCKDGEEDYHCGAVNDAIVGSYAFRNIYQVPFPASPGNIVNSNTFAHSTALLVWSESDLPSPTNGMWGWGSWGVGAGYN